MENFITGERIGDFLTAKGINFEHKKMFGGLCLEEAESIIHYISNLCTHRQACGRFRVRIFSIHHEGANTALHQV